VVLRSTVFQDKREARAWIRAEGKQIEVAFCPEPASQKVCDERAGSFGADRFQLHREGVGELGSIR